VIDPVLDFDMASGVADTRSAERIVAFAHDHDWRIAMVLAACRTGVIQTV